MSRGWLPADTPASSHPQKAAGGSQTDPQAYQMLRLRVVRNPHPHPQVHQARPWMAHYCCSFSLHCPSVGHQQMLLSNICWRCCALHSRSCLLTSSNAAAT